MKTASNKLVWGSYWKQAVSNAKKETENEHGESISLIQNRRSKQPETINIYMINLEKNYAGRAKNSTAAGTPTERNAVISKPSSTKEVRHA